MQMRDVMAAHAEINARHRNEIVLAFDPGPSLGSFWNGVCRPKVEYGRLRTDLERWPDGSYRWLPHNPKRPKRNINVEREVRRAMRMATR